MHVPRGIMIADYGLAGRAWQTRLEISACCEFL
jgi:hypothetical protein